MSRPTEAFAVRLYRRLFRAWMPAGFREEMERPALEAFEDLYLETQAYGRRAAAGLLFREVASLVRVGLQERLGRRRSPTSRRRPPAERGRDSLARDAVGDVKVGLRNLRRNPGFTAIALVALALGIGMNTAIVSLALAVFLEPLPYPEADRLGVVSSELVDGGGGFSMSYLDLRDLDEQNRVFSELASFLDWQSVNLSGGDRPERVAVNFVTPGYLRMLGFRPLFGRLFAPGDDGEGPRDPVVILGHALWQRSFGGEPGVVGRSVVLNGIPFQIVGVLSEEVSDLGQRFGEVAGAYVPLAWVPRLVQLDIYERRTARYLFGLARLRPGVSLSEASSDLRQISTRLAGDHPETNEGWRFIVQSIPELLLGNARGTTTVLLVGAGLVLLLVCANVAGLQLIQGVRRSRELAMRRALGAGGARVARQLVTESLLLSLLGGALGTVVAFWGIVILSRLEALQLPSFAALTLDGRALSVSFGLATLTGLLFGLAPALRASRVDALSGLRDGRGGAGHGLARSGFLVAEIALAVVLLASAALALESFRRLHGMELGFETDGLLSAQLDLRGERYDEPEARRALALDLVERATSLPGVETAFLWGPSRLGGGNWVRFVTREHRYEESEERIEASRHHVLPGALGRLGIPILAGRDFRASDRAGAQPVVIVSESLDERLWPDESAVGRRLDTCVGEEVVTYEVVGVAADARHRSRVEVFLDEDYDLYFSYLQEPERNLGLLVRAQGGERRAAGLVPLLRRTVSEVDPTLPIYDVATMNDRLWQEEGRSRLSAILLGAYAVLALALAAVGVYGTLALAVRQRVREIGVRMALGARVTDIVGQVIGYGVRVFFVGAALGLLGSFAAARLLSSALLGITSLDASRLLFVIAGLGLVGAAGCYFPARQASRVDPTVALREE